MVVLFYNLGIAYAKKGNFTAAIYEYKNALKIDPDDKRIYNNLGTSYANVGNLEAAINNFQAAIRIDPNYTNARINLENILNKVRGPTTDNQAVRIN